MKLEQIRVALHDEVLRQAGFKDRDSKLEEYLKFSTALSKLVDRKAEASESYYQSEDAEEELRKMLEEYSDIKYGDATEIE
jgi:hypothetical protein